MLVHIIVINMPFICKTWQMYMLEGHFWFCTWFKHVNQGYSIYKITQDEGGMKM